MSRVIKTKCSLLLLRASVSRPTIRMRERSTNENKRSTGRAGFCFFIGVNCGDGRAAPVRPCFAGAARTGRLRQGGMKCLLVIIVQQHRDNGGFILAFGQAAAQRHEALAAFDQQFIALAQARLEQGRDAFGLRPLPRRRE